MNFFQYLGTEENNLLTSFHNYRREFDYFSHLDGLFQAVGGKLKVEKDPLIALFWFVHFHLYSSIAAIYRMHASECWVSNRKAIDGILSAYRMIEEPGSRDLYLKRDSSFQFIRNYLADIRKKDATKYPLAQTLLDMHGRYSELGGHADVNSFVHRTAVAKTDRPGFEMFLFHFFQIPETPEESRAYILDTLTVFLRALLIFLPFLKKQADGFDFVRWEAEVQTLGDAMIKDMGALEKALESSSQGGH